MFQLLDSEKEKFVDQIIEIVVLDTLYGHGNGLKAKETKELIKKDLIELFK